ncbi:MAG: ROK family transcriptional regulator [Spirochaetaceae bacterium]|nr:MAG: ROK family transcriptional regulator [Spirochaetaceae bacterium]
MQKNAELQKPLDQNSIKLANRKAILDLLLRERILTRQEITARTGFSFPTVSNTIASLLEQGVVREAGIADSTGGRRPLLIEINPDCRFALGVTIQPRDIRVVRTNIDIRIMDEMTVPIRRNATGETVTAAVTDALETMISRSGEPLGAFLGIGIAVAGYVNRKTISIEAAPSLGLREVSFAPISRKLGLPLYIENEGNAAALAEQHLGIAQGMDNLIYISIVEGVASGTIIAGKLYMGAHNRAGELGHITIEPGGRPCSCGRRGCWEQYVSEDVLLGEYRLLRENDSLTLAHFFQELSDQQEDAVVLWESYVEYMIRGLHTVVAMYDPHYIIIGGSIAEYPQYLLPPLMKGLFKSTTFYTRSDTYILVSELKKDAFILGAALLPMATLPARIA